MKDPQSCPKCNSMGEPKATRCTSCGSWLQGARRVRRLGGVMILMGLFLVVLMGLITIAVAPKMLSIGASSTPSGFNGTPKQAMTILLLFGTIILFGFAATINGVWQIFTGRRNVLLFIVVLLLAFGIIGTAVVTVQSLPQKDERNLEPQKTEILQPQKV